MRLSERLLYIFGLCQVMFQFIDNNYIQIDSEEVQVYNFFIMGICFITLMWGGALEGIRFQQWIFIVTFIVYSVLIMLQVYSNVAIIIYLIVILISILNIAFFGEANFNALEMVGAYQVGHMEFYTRKGGNGVSVYYPMDKAEYNR